VGICIERSLAMVIGLLGIIKAGGAYLPLDPAYPAARLAFMLDDAQVAVLLTQSSLKKGLPETTAQVVCLDTENKTLSSLSTDNLASGVTPSNLAYVIYTSGSTGIPKGAGVFHKGFTNLVLWFVTDLKLTGDDSTLIISPYSFDLTQKNFFAPLILGGQLHLLPSTYYDPQSIIQLIATQTITWINCTPSAFYPLTETDSTFLKLASLRYAVLGGEPISLPRLWAWLQAESCQAQLINSYGPTECTDVCVAYLLDKSTLDQTIPIGRPIYNVHLFILDKYRALLPIGVPGELYIGGECVGSGYFNDVEMTQSQFIPNPFSDDPDARIYKTGDLARYLPDGNIEYLGRIDNQVKMRGFRIELGEIEAVLAQYPTVQESVVIVHQERLVAYLVPTQEQVIDNVELRFFLKERLPDYMIPSLFMPLDAMPLSPNGKIDRRALPKPDDSRPSLEAIYVMPQTEAEQRIAEVWQQVLQLEKVGIYDNFFDLGGHSLLMVRVHSELQEIFGQSLSMVELFQYPTIHSLAKHLTQETQQTSEVFKTSEVSSKSKEIAIIGMAGRFPGAKNIETFWQNLRDGIESITFFSEEELLAEGVDPALLKNPNYVKANGVLEKIELFDAAFFGYSPKEAEIMDPQQRLFLECAWDAIENAGYDVDRISGAVGVYAGAGMNTYLSNNITRHPDIVESVGEYQLMITSEKDFLPTRTSYKLNLKGPSVYVQTACSTSLVAVHLACQSLHNNECDMALAGGVSVRARQKIGYLYQEGMIMSPDGHCRAFDAKAQGTIGGNGVGIVVLKRLDQALADGDCIHAVIKGSAINNDGSLKVGYTAPSVDGQTSVIAAAMKNIDYETISYIETHGTGTTLGDPIEMAALTQAYQSHTDKKGFCAIGSLKTNVGHLDAAAGVAGLIKTVLALKHKQLPPSLHFDQPNPKIDFANSPFFVNTALSEWKSDGKPRRASVSSFGIGGTNAHVVLEEAPDQLSVISDQLSEKPGIHRTWQLLVLSAKTASALETATANLAERFKQHPDINFADVAYTLSVGRQIFEHRRILVCQTLDEATELLSTPEHLFTQVQEHKARPVVFMFSGQGSQYVNMARELYQNESIFREHVDKCAEILKPHLSLDLRKVIYPNAEQITKQLEQTAIAQPALFVIEYALAQLWMVWGIHPVAMIGHSIGEYVAACLAGVFSLEDALALVAARGQLMQSLPGGAMLSVPLPESEILPLLNSEISLAAINTPTLCVVSGTLDAITTLENQLTKQSVDGLRLQTSHAFHSAMMEPILASFTAHVKKIRLNPPQIPYLSNVSGTWITAEQATDPDYWATHLRQTVRFAENLQELLKKPEYVLLEIGPGRTLTTLAGRHPDKTAEHNVVHTLRHPKEQPADMAFLLTTLGKLWLAGVSIDWPAFYAQAQYHRLPLPTYPFERQRYWIVPPTDAALTNVVAPSPTKKSDIADWFYIPSWKRSVLQTSEVLKTSEVLWLVFVDECGLAHQLVKRLQSHNVITVKKGKAFTQLSERDYTLNPQKRDDYEALLKKLNKVPQIIVHLWTVTDHLKSVEKAQELGFYSLLYLAQALTDVSDEIQLAVVSNNLHDVTGEEVLCPEKATVLGPVKVIGQEYPNIRCRSIDVVIPPSGINHKLIEPLLAELTSKSSDQVIAYRGKHRWVQTFEPVRLDKPVEETSRLRKNGVYLITGGLGQIGLVLAEHLAKTVQAKLILIGRSALPARDEWEDWLNTHDEHDEISRKIRKVQALEKLGAEVWVASVDVANLQQMQEVITIAEKRFGQINGVIHAAGMIGENTFRTIEQADQTHCEQQFQPKIHGTLVLEKVLQERKLDFCILLSSLSAVLGGLSYVAYSTANIFMDAFVQQHNQNHHMLWLSVNWDGWRFENETQPSSSLAQFALLPEEGVNAFQRILDYKGSNQLVVSTGNLQVRIDQWIKLERTNTKEVAPRYHRPKLPTSYVAPRDDVEQTLVEIWQQLLGIEQIGIHDEFFKLGGDSLIAVRLFTQIEKRIGKNLPMTTLIQAPTVEQLSNIIRQKGGLKPWSKSWSSLVPIQPSGGKRPFFLVPGGGGGKGEIMLYAKLVYLLGQEQPVYGLLARGLDGKQNPHTQVEAMATDYINEIRAFQPNGPYLLGGECIGGLVAFEMAQQLQAQGQIVSLLVLMDTMCPSGSSYFTYLVYRFFKIRKIRHHWKTISELEPERRLSYLFEKAKKAIWMLIAKFHINSVPPAQQIQQVSNEYEKTLMRYRPKVYPGSLVLLVSEGNYKQNPTSGWETLAKQGLEIYKLPGDHTSYIREEVQTTAKQLKACLDEAQQNISNVHRS
jgi:amino acid adenylation domain-containing protein